MKLHGIALFFIMVFLIRAGDQMNITEISDKQSVIQDSITWLGEAKQIDIKSKPVFAIEDAAKGIGAKGWLAYTKDNLFIRLEVKDSIHIAPDKRTIWGGDGLEICIDAYGDGVGNLAKDARGPFDLDDAKFMIALTTDGPVGLCITSRNNDIRGVMPAEYVKINRDDAVGKTDYDIIIPWSFLSTPPGIFPEIGMAIQINNKQEAKKEKVDIRWGDGTYGAFRPGLFNRVKLDNPSGSYQVIGIRKTILWDEKEQARMIVAYSSDKELNLKVKSGEEEKTFKLPPSKKIRRYKITIRPDEEFAEIPLEAIITDGTNVLATVKDSIESPQGYLKKTLSKLDECIAKAKEPLLLRHLKSVKALLKTEWSRLEIYRKSNPSQALLSYQLTREILNGLNADAGTWKPYLEKRRNMIFAYVSDKDRTLQFYFFSLPKNWEAGKKYPLYFELHGAGSENPLSFVASQVGNRKTGGGLYGYSAPMTYYAQHGEGYYCQPFGRGNQGYRGIGEVDIWEAYDDLHNNFQVDKTRQYLFGFSMGGGGTWAIGTRTPDRWAAIAVLAGAVWREKKAHGLGRNLTNTPVFLWCGESDSIFAFMKPLQEEMNKYKVNLKVKSTPNLGHNYIPEIQKEVFEWLNTHTLKRPDNFSFVADTPEHLGVWGIDMTRDLTKSGLPSFTCKIDGNTINIQSEGTPGILVDPGKDGLAMEGEITIIWNGKEVYKGPAVKKQFGESEGDLRYRRSR